MRLSTALLLIPGSYLVYCAQQGFPSGSGGSSSGFSSSGNMVRDASAQDANCCTPAMPQFVKIAEGDVSRAAPVSATITVGAYREVVVDASSTGTLCYPALYATFSVDGTAPFGSTGQVPPGRLRVDGAAMKLAYSCDSGSVHYVVAGVR